MKKAPCNVAADIIRLEMGASNVNCPLCTGTMEPGELDLKAWGSGLAPQAQLHFNNELILKNQYVPVVGLFSDGSKVTAHRCTACRLICFQYS